MPTSLRQLYLFDPSAPLLFTGGQFLLWFTLFYVGFLWLRSHAAARLLYLAAFSWFFYYKCSGVFLAALLFTTVSDFVIARAIAATCSQGKKKLLLALSITLSGGILVYFKYTNFFVGSLAHLASIKFEPFDIALPAGISFYTFESISYAVDVYRGRLEPSRNFLEYAAYLAYFPHLMAGPIMRAGDLFAELRAQKPIDASRVGSGLFLAMCGLIKKVVIADTLARFTDAVFAGASGLSGFEVLLGVYGYAFQIYCDFSGYSDIAIGLARVCGVDLPRNFLNPYAAASITDFWHRWHITLSSWLRDYIYIPLGGNRRGRLRTYVNLFATMLFGGLWHGASMTFVLWGAAHGLLLCLEKACSRALGRVTSSTFGRLLSTVLTFHIVALLWVPFRAGNLHLARQLLGRIVGDWDAHVVSSVLHARFSWLLVLGVGIALSLLAQGVIERLAQGFARRPLWVKSIALLVVVQATLEFRSTDVQPFIYFQF